LLASARGSNVRPDAPVGDAEMAAILGVLKGDEGDDDGAIRPERSDPSDRDDGGEPEEFESSNAPAAG
jgi:hypothetical protein